MQSKSGFFLVNTKQYDVETNYHVVRPSSLLNPSDNSVMFMIKEHMDKAACFQAVSDCLIFWPIEHEVLQGIRDRNAVVQCVNPHLEFCKFFRDHGIESIPRKEEYRLIDGAYVAAGAKIGKDVILMPNSYIGSDVVIGDHSYIGVGVKIVGSVEIGKNVIIRENTVLGADGLTTDRDESGKSVVMPQFGRVIIEDNVRIGALTVIARGAIDDTVIRTGCRIDSCCFISHNVDVGEDAFIVGESILFGSVSVGSETLVSGNSTIRNGVHIGNNAVIGMGSVVVKDVPNNTVVKGNPAK